MVKKIVVLAGDGIGPEIMASGLAVLKKAVEHSDVQFEFDAQDFGGSGIDAKGEPLPSETLAACQSADAILLGAIGGPKWEQAEKTPEQGLLALRRELNLFANIRPISVPDALLPLSPIKENIVKGTDFIVVRELTSGIYFGEPRHLGENEAYDTNRYNVDEIKRIIRQAFEIASGRRKHVLSVDKANVLATSKLWRKVAEEVAQEFPDCTLEHQYVDSAAMRIVQNPTAFDVIVTENLFGDILSDEASVLPGTLGVLPSASHGESGVSLYEPIHGSAPDIAGKNIANPVSMILSASLMLRQSFDMHEEADRIETACFEAMEEGILTKDLGGTTTTTAFTEAILAKLA
ncbi:3-isopropylmalate dehydrogenase [Enterococcus saccharolyticus]|uniref:3-isopropylmalate dehydrogenase n=1 Tax=Enterococcus saccharolyticus TaxID=41997 RepID=UPI001E4677E5|nr:3-isopropylmalate dehydrogenase [Enterococcus saccharolyticus]MCD5001823.1 3-isopropylmalate dehydrogenase [Enterococcus saccharolyticus]